MSGGPKPGDALADSTNARIPSKDELTNAENSSSAIDDAEQPIESHAKGDAPAVSRRGFRFWAVIAGLCIANFQASLENSVVVTSGPKIVEDLQMGEEYIWITNAFFVCWYVCTK